MNQADFHRSMNRGFWVWPSDPKEQEHLVDQISRSEHLTAALAAIMKSKEGLSNAELDDVLSDSSNWMTLWVTRQLLSLTLIEYKVDFFGNPGRYTLTELGREVLQRTTGQPAPVKPQVQPTMAPAPVRVSSPPPAASSPQKPSEPKPSA